MTTILVIEDEPEILENTIEILELEAFEVIGAKNGRTGLALAQEQRPDLILCDVRMPDLDGFGVLDALKKDPETAAIPFLFLSAKADKASIQQGLARGAVGYLTKPFMPAELLTQVLETLRR